MRIKILKTDKLLDPVLDNHQIVQTSCVKETEAKVGVENAKN